MPDTGTPSPFVGNLRRLLAQIETKRRIQLALVFALSLVGAVAEMATLGAAVPFLSVLAGTGNSGQCASFSVLCDLTPLQISLGFAAIIIAAMAIRLLLLWSSTRFAYALGADLGREVYRRTLHQPYSFHVERNSSQIIAAVNKTNHLVTGVIVPFMQGGVALIIVLAIFGALLAVDISTALIAMTGIGTFYVVVSTLTKRILRRNSQIVAQAETTRVKILQEGLGGIRDILLQRSQTFYVKRFNQVTLEQKQAQATNLFLRNTPRYVIEAAGMIVMVGLAWWIQQRQGLAAALPTLGALAIGAQRMLPQLQQVYFAWSSLSANRSILGDVLEFLALPKAVPSAKNLPTRSADWTSSAAISVQHVFFSHKGGEPILRDVCIEVPRGSRVGFIGKTGSGKSTLIDLILGLLAPDQGRIIVDGVDLVSDNLEHWQRRVAHVPQVIYLTDGSIAENIALGIDPSEIDLDKVAEACARAQLGDFIDSLPRKYETIVGERGVRISGGQRQRIGIARAFYQDADVLVLDEATSALDDQTEDLVMQGVGSLGNEKTILMVAHRLTTLRTCDVVIEMEGGRIKRSGSYDQIIRSDYWA